MKLGALGAKVGPLPMGVWLLVGGGGLFIAWRSSKNNPDEAEAPAAAGDALPTGGGSAISSWDNAPVVLSPIVNVQPPSVVVNNHLPKPAPVVITKPKPLPVSKAPPRVPVRRVTPKPVGKPAAKRRYTVVKGDTLYDIAKRQYGNPAKWPMIYAANAGTIEAAARSHGKAISAGGHWIYPGSVLVIP